MRRSTTPRVAHVATVDLTLRFLLLAQLRRLRDEGFEVTAISAPGPWVEDLRAEGIRHVAWPHATRSWDPRADLLAFGELVGILRRGRYHLVHTHNPKPGILGRLAARMAGVPCVVNTVHGLYATPEDPLPRRAGVLGLEWLAARFSDLELYQSEEDLAWARRLRVVREARSELLGNGVDLDRFDPEAVPAGRVAALREELGIPEGAVVVGTVGRLVAEKGCRELFEAARRVRAARPEVRFVAVGDVDPEKADSISRAELASMGEDLTVTGWRDDVRDLLAAMDVFVLASWREGVPRSAVEAAAMGRAMVLTDIRGCREVGRDGVEALLVPPRDPGALSGAILRLVEDPGLRERLGAAARRRARERFDERRVAGLVAARTRSLLAGRGLLPRVERADEAGRAAGRPGAPDPEGRPAVRPARPWDAPAMARLHRQGLPGAFLTTLGEGFLRRLYRAMAEDPEAVALVAEDGRGVVGFATGVPSVGAFYRRFGLRHGLPAVLSAAPSLVRPAVLARALETARYPSAASSLPPSELLSIAVDPRCRQAGVGRALAEAVVEGLGRRGAREVKVVVGADNEAANRFYARLGFVPGPRIAVHRGAPSNVWIRRWPSPSP